MKIEVYQSVEDPMLRMAVEAGSGLPAHVDPADWKLMPAGSSQIIHDAVEDIGARGFCVFKLIAP